MVTNPSQHKEYLFGRRLVLPAEDSYSCLAISWRDWRFNRRFAQSTGELTIQHLDQKLALFPCLELNTMEDTKNTAPKDKKTRIEQALILSGDKNNETNEVFQANAEAEKDVAKKTGKKQLSLLAKLVTGRGRTNIHKEIQFSMPPTTNEAKTLGEIVARRLKEGTLFDEGTGKIAEATFEELRPTGYFGLLVPKEVALDSGDKVQLEGRGLSCTQTGDVIFSMVKNGSFDLGVGISPDQGIGLVSPLVMYGNDQQKIDWLIPKARGLIRSWFALTEEQAGSAVGRIAMRFVQDPDDPEMLLVYGHKRFTTGVRLSTKNVISAGVLVGLDDQNEKRSLIAQLPEEENDTFKFHAYKLLPIYRAWNIGMEFNGFRVPKKNLIGRKGMVVPFSLLNRGRYFLLAGALGTTLKYLKGLVGNKIQTGDQYDYKDIGWTKFRVVQGRQIMDYQIVEHRLTRMLGMSVTLRALMASMGFELDAGKLAEIEGLIAKPTASWYINEAGDLSLVTWGGRGLIEDNASAAEINDRRAVKIYEGEDTVLILKLIAMLLNDLNETTLGGMFDGLARMIEAKQTFATVGRKLFTHPGVETIGGLTTVTYFDGRKRMFHFKGEQLDQVKDFNGGWVTYRGQWVDAKMTHAAPFKDVSVDRKSGKVTYLNSDQSELVIHKDDGERAGVLRLAARAVSTGALGLGKLLLHLPGVLWWLVRKVARLSYGQPLKGMHPELKSDLAFALRVLERQVPLRAFWLMAKFGTTLPRHQSPLFRLGQKVMWANLIMHTVLWVHQFGDSLETEAALDNVAQLRRLILTPEPTAKDDARATKIAKRILKGECRMLDDVPVQEIPLVYHEPHLGPFQGKPTPDPRLGWPK